jgi:hypothetical protein
MPGAALRFIIAGVIENASLCGQEFLLFSLTF